MIWIDRTIVGFGILERDETTERGVKYKLSLTQYVTSILSGIDENNRLGISVTQNLAATGVARVKNQTQPLEITRIPVGSAISPEGTVLYGNVTENMGDPSKRLKLKIFYTEVN